MAPNYKPYDQSDEQMFEETHELEQNDQLLNIVIDKQRSQISAEKQI